MTTDTMTYAMPSVEALESALEAAEIEVGDADGDGRETTYATYEDDDWLVELRVEANGRWSYGGDGWDEPYWAECERAWGDVEVERAERWDGEAYAEVSGDRLRELERLAQAALDRVLRAW